MVVEISLSEAVNVKSVIPELHQHNSLQEIQKRVGNHYLALGFRIDNRLVGFKLGYAINETRFYSWIGGVHPDFRNRGIARALLLAQEQWCKDKGFSVIEVKSMNRYKAMLCMLINNNYHIIDIAKAQQSFEHKILFSKQL